MGVRPLSLLAYQTFRDVLYADMSFLFRFFFFFRDQDGSGPGTVTENDGGGWVAIAWDSGRAARCYALLKFLDCFPVLASYAAPLLLQCA